MHTLVCRDDDKWSVHVREHQTVPWSFVAKEASGRLQEAIETSLRRFDPAQFNWTFSERQADEVTSTYVVEDPISDHVVIAARGLDAAIYCREGRLDDA